MISFITSVLLSFSLNAAVDEAKIAKHRSECSAGKFEWCAGLGSLEQEAGRKTEAKVAYEKACGAGLALSCRARAMLAREEGDTQGTLKYLEASCKIHSNECSTLKEYKLALEEEPKFSSMKKSCEETGDKVCNVLAMRLTNLGRQKEALDIYDLACEKGNSEACRWGANFFPPEKAVKMHTRACELGNGSSCERISEGNPTLREQLLRKGCDKGQLSVCGTLGMHLNANGKQEEAKMILEKACEKGHVGACKNLNWLLRKK